MTIANQLDRRVTFRQRAADANGSRTGAWTDVVTRDARVQPLKGGEGVQAARLAGQQPVIITVRRDRTTALIDNSYDAKDARAAADSPPLLIFWDIASAILTEDREWVEVLATQRLGGSEDDE